MAWVMHISQRGIELIKQFEGLRLTAYADPVGIWTIGYGTTRDEHARQIQPGMTITAAEAEGLLMKDLTHFEIHVNRLVTVDVNQNQFDALMSFTYNVGVKAFSESTLLKLLNRGNTEGAAKQFTRWTQANGKVLPGLTRRREAERDLFVSEEA